MGKSIFSDFIKRVGSQEVLQISKIAEIKQLLRLRW